MRLGEDEVLLKAGRKIFGARMGESINLSKRRTCTE